MYTLKAQVEHQVTYAVRYNNRLSICNLPQRAAIEVIEVGMGYKHEVDFRQVVQTDAGTLDSFQHFQPKRPDRVHENVQPAPTDQKRGVADPGQADFLRVQDGKSRPQRLPFSPGKQRGQINFGDKVSC